jgi:uncharacterized membrane protein YqiK
MENLNILGLTFIITVIIIFVVLAIYELFFAGNYNNSER